MNLYLKNRNNISAFQKQIIDYKRFSCSALNIISTYSTSVV